VATVATKEMKSKTCSVEAQLHPPKLGKIQMEAPAPNFNSQKPFLSGLDWANQLCLNDRFSRMLQSRAFPKKALAPIV
jgi:hypothetical protein